MSLKTKKTRPQFQRGVTLIEMMIAMVLGLFVVGAITSVFLTNVKTNTANLKMIRLNQELRGAMTFMVDEIKRTGYSADPGNALFINAFDASTASCILYSYDADNDGTQGPNELFGFRLDTDDDEIKWSNSATTACDFSQPITDANMATIDSLSFDVSNSVNQVANVIGTNALSAATGVSVYDVTITLTGSTDLLGADDPSRTITETIRVRNDAPKS